MFHYVYAVLHHPQYRERYAANLRRELPRITFVRWGQCPDAPGAGGSAAFVIPLPELFWLCSGTTLWTANTGHSAVVALG